MKAFLFTLVALLVLFNKTSGQCPKPGVQIQSEACEPPRYLKVNVLSCTEVELTWKGTKNQTYAVSASFTDALTNESIDAKISEVSCDSDANCRTTFSAKEETVVSLKVQGVCQIENASIYSTEVNALEIHLPFCEKKKDFPSVDNLRVYPNPASDFLLVEYSGRDGVSELRIMDIVGKKVLSKPEVVLGANSQYRLSLRGLPAGTYLLEAVIGKDARRTKFVVVQQ
jgi:hypothetical protein